MAEIQKPLCLKIEEAKQELFSTINLIVKKHNLTFYLFEGIVKEAYQQTIELAKVERERAIQAYQKQLNEENQEG